VSDAGASEDRADPTGTAKEEGRFDFIKRYIQSVEEGARF